MDRFIAMEGIISKIRNRKVRSSRFATRDTYTKYKNIEELFAALSTPENGRGSEACGIIEGLYYALEIRSGGESNIEAAKRFAKRVQSQIGKAQSILAKAIVDEYNSSNGKEGPWEWINSDDDFSPKSVSDVTSKISLETAEIVVKADDIRCDLWFDDGNLWYGHVIITHNLFDASGKMTPDKMSFTVEG